jgi:hypothetical protein
VNLRIFVFVLCFVATFDAVAAPACEGLRLERLNAAVWVAKATQSEGFRANLSVVVLPSGVVVFSTGPGLHVAEPLRCAIAKNIGKPVLRIALPQSLPENVLGSAAFAKVIVMATAKTGELMVNRCPLCRQRFVDQLGPRFAALTPVIQPNDLRNQSQRIAVGGGRIEWLTFAPALMPGNSALWHASSRTILAGALVTHHVVPDASEADIDAWLSALDAMNSFAPRFVVPDRGAPGDTSLIAMTRSYLQLLRDEVERAFLAGVDVAEVAAVVDGAAFKSWGEFEERHGPNVRAEMLRREAAALRRR